MPSPIRDEKGDQQQQGPGLVRSERLYLERLDPDTHLDDFRELWTDPEATKWSTKPPNSDPEQLRPWMLSMLTNEEQPDIDKYAIMLLPSQEEGIEKNREGKTKMIGLIGTNRWCKPNEGTGLETGYCLTIKYWNKGYATEALAMFLKYYWTLPERKWINPLISKTHPENIASHRVLQKCGARRGETLEKVYKRYLDDGAMSDVWCWYFERPSSSAAENEERE